MGIALFRTHNSANGGPDQEKHLDFSVLSNEELWALEALLAKAGVCEALGSVANRQHYKPELLEPETLARIANG